MVIKKAAWRAFESLSEPRTADQWVWLGRSTPMWWEVIWSGFLQPPPAGAPVIVFPTTPPPQISFVDRPYTVSDTEGVFSTLGWDSTHVKDGLTYRLISQHWQTGGWTRTAVILRVGNDCRVWLGRAPLTQRDARLDSVRLSPYGQGIAAGENLVALQNPSGNAIALRCVTAQHQIPEGIFDMTGGAVPASITFSWV